MLTRGERLLGFSVCRDALRHGVVLLILAFGVLLVAPSVACGAASFSNALPAPASVTSSPRPLISIDADDEVALAGPPSSWMRVDGLLVSATFSYKVTGGHWEYDEEGEYWVVDYDYTYATMSFTPRSDLANGLHTVTASFMNNAGERSTTTWTFSVGAPPVLAEFTPADGSSIEETMPTISARVIANGDGSVARMLVDGVETPATYEPATGLVSGVPTLPLGIGVTHTVELTVTNGIGQSTSASWSFYVKSVWTMPLVTECDLCHTSYPAAHTMTNCDACHGPGSPVGGSYGPPDFHPDGEAAEFLQDCTWCHDGSYVTVPTHPFEPDDYHVADTTGCTACHLVKLPDEHASRTESVTGDPMTCLSCHTSSDSRVSGAIADGNTDCFACHDVTHAFVPGHASTETETVTYGCGGDPASTWDDCHAAESVAAPHSRLPGGGCPVCHGPSSTPSTRCRDCHVLDRALHHESQLRPDCAACHHHDNLFIGSASRRRCAECHTVHPAPESTGG